MITPAIAHVNSVAVLQPESLPAGVDSVRDGVGYRVTAIELGYAIAHADLPDLGEVLGLEVMLTPVDGGYIGPVPGAEIIPVRLGEIGKGGVETIYGSALAAMVQAVRNEMESRYEFLGHLVTPSKTEIAFDTTQEDLRGDGDHPLTILIWRAVVGEVRTVARGDRIAERETDDEESNVNHPAHQRIRDRFEIVPGDLLTKEKVDREIHHFNRHSGRRLDVSIAPSSEPGAVVLDYLITEPKQWSVYASISNTGTKSTDEWQERFGYVHRQLTGQDDVFTLDYITAGFDASHAVLASYSFDLGPDYRARINARWNQYTATDLGLGFADFKGEGYEFGAEVSRNIWNDGAAFLDVFAGVRYEHIKVENRIFFLTITGEDNFLLPFGGLRYQKNTPLHTAFAELRFETNLASAAGTSELPSIAALGRTGVENEFSRISGQVSHSFFLEPIFDPKGFKGERGENKMTLAHEIVFSVRGQSSLGSRLVPNFQMTAGGASSVRGYKESVAVGDNAIIGSLEYRFHLGKATPITTSTTTLFGSTFRNARTRPYGASDWDLIFSGFVDIGRVTVQDALFFENDETLVGVGVGLEAQLKRNLTVRVNYGMALTRIGTGAAVVTDVGDSRLHFSATVVY
ncbi:MAG: ShlB/FhaC/HecB family hemolysin secretion/activation protein [Phycisphaerales bacterium]|nr:ShlB/FhaC/HecB family hemolysin secretion/activation protein [Phycisphaerales bacterium]